MLTKKTIGFIGAGNMGEALIKGLLASKKMNAGQILVADKVKERLAYITEHYEVKVFQKKTEIVLLKSLKQSERLSLLKMKNLWMR